MSNGGRAGCTPDEARSSIQEESPDMAVEAYELTLRTLTIDELREIFSLAVNVQMMGQRLEKLVSPLLNGDGLDPEPE
jgi:hypothetical protein